MFLSTDSNPFLIELRIPEICFSRSVFHLTKAWAVEKFGAKCASNSSVHGNVSQSTDRE